MEAKISNIELTKFINTYYLKIELSNNKGTYIVNNPLLCGPFSFKTELLGLLYACDCYDLLNLSSNNPIKKEVTAYFANGIKILENENNEFFEFNFEKGYYECKKDLQKKAVINELIKTESTDIKKEKGIISSILSYNGTFQLLFSGENNSSFMLTNQIYYGIDLPFQINGPQNIIDLYKSAKNFYQFIISIMKFYNITNILELSGNINNLPIVDLKFKNNKIYSITNPSSKTGLIIGKIYSIGEINNNKYKTRKKHQ